MATKRKKKAARRKVEVLSGPSQTDERRWQAEDDVRTLTRAEEIKNDRGRLSRAQAMAKKQAAEAAKVANSLGSRSKKRRS